jgi:hypothetical protein
MRRLDKNLTFTGISYVQAHVHTGSRLSLDFAEKLLQCTVDISSILSYFSRYYIPNIQVAPVDRLQLHHIVLWSGPTGGMMAKYLRVDVAPQQTSTSLSTPMPHTTDRTQSPSHSPPPSEDENAPPLSLKTSKEALIKVSETVAS